jgi:hypothetical protein
MFVLLGSSALFGCRCRSPQSKHRHISFHFAHHDSYFENNSQLSFSSRVRQDTSSTQVQLSAATELQTVQGPKQRSRVGFCGQCGARLLRAEFCLKTKIGYRFQNGWKPRGIRPRILRAFLATHLPRPSSCVPTRMRNLGNQAHLAAPGVQWRPSNAI